MASCELFLRIEEPIRNVVSACGWLYIEPLTFAGEGNGNKPSQDHTAHYLVSQVSQPHSGRGLFDNSLNSSRPVTLHNMNSFVILLENCQRISMSGGQALDPHC